MTDIPSAPGSNDIFMAVAQRHADDLAWAIANVTPVIEGPWEAAPNQQVFYVGVKPDGFYTRLEKLPKSWRYQPAAVMLSGGSDFHYVTMRGPLVVRIELGPDMSGILARRPFGQQPMQMDGLIDGQEFYFREDNGVWLLSVGGTDVVEAPDWYHEDEHKTDGWISEDQAYELLAKGAALFRKRNAEQRQNNGEKE